MDDKVVDLARLEGAAMKQWWLGVLAALLGVTQAQAAGDAAAGKMVFEKCQACHSLKPGETKIGPSLHGLFGRKAGTVPDFSYSQAMVQSSLIWDEATLARYLPDPQALVHHTKMSFIGLSDPQEVADVIAYLRRATK
jgi:cytochrome c2